MEGISVKLPTPLGNALAAEARRQNVTQLTIVGEALERCLLDRPGEMLLEEFLNPMGLTQRELADAIHVPYQRINDIVNGRRGITPRTALRLAKYFNMSADFWMNVQLRWDMHFAQKDEITVLETIKPSPGVAG